MKWVFYCFVCGRQVCFSLSYRGFLVRQFFSDFGVLETGTCVCSVFLPRRYDSDGSISTPGALSSSIGNFHIPVLMFAIKLFNPQQQNRRRRRAHFIFLRVKGTGYRLRLLLLHVACKLTNCMVVQFTLLTSPDL